MEWGSSDADYDKRNRKRWDLTLDLIVLGIYCWTKNILKTVLMNVAKLGLQTKEKLWKKIQFTKTSVGKFVLYFDQSEGRFAWHCRDH